MTDFEAFAHAAWPRLVALGVMLTHDRTSAEDLSQDVLTRVYADWPKVGGMEAPFAYARRALINRHVDEARRFARTRRIFGRTMKSGDAPDMSEASDVSMDLWRAIRSLPPRQLAVIVLRYYEDLDDEEIADTLGVSTGTVRSQAKRALDHLRPSVTKEFREIEYGSTER